MASDHTKVECEIHGDQEEAFACQHIVSSVVTGIPVAFFGLKNQTKNILMLGVSSVEDARIEAGGDWTPEVEKLLSVKLLCGACYEYAKSNWENGRKLTQ